MISIKTTGNNTIMYKYFFSIELLCCWQGPEFISTNEKFHITPITTNENIIDKTFPVVMIQQQTASLLFHERPCRGKRITLIETVVNKKDVCTLLDKYHLHLKLTLSQISKYVWFNTTASFEQFHCVLYICEKVEFENTVVLMILPSNQTLVVMGWSQLKSSKSIRWNIIVMVIIKSIKIWIENLLRLNNIINYLIL